MVGGGIDIRMLAPSFRECDRQQQCDVRNPCKVSNQSSQYKSRANSAGDTGYGNEGAGQRKEHWTSSGLVQYGQIYTLKPSDWLPGQR